MGAVAAAVVSLLAATAVWSWSSAITSDDAVIRRAPAAFAAAAAIGLVGLAVHRGKHQSGGTIAGREQRALFRLAVAALVLLVTLGWIELNARAERRRRLPPPPRAPTARSAQLRDRVRVGRPIAPRCVDLAGLVAGEKRVLDGRVG